MTEAEWLACTDSFDMLLFLHEKASDRKLRLFACAYVREGWHLLADERSRRSVEIAEQHADGLSDDASLDRACDEADDAISNSRELFLNSGKGEVEGRAFEGSCAAHWVAVEEAWEAALQQLHWHFIEDESTIQSALLHDIIGNPFRTATITPEMLNWHGGLLVSMAQRMYDSYDFTDVPILADALEEAGCTNADILNHCRQPGEHVRGCWVIDLLLGKE
ncbi:MAG TPA: hypothetical protein VE999_09020 [Gemmataceae bacterium]|nr:hypothetical protein [Gemmataceae bacterium]